MGRTHTGRVAVEAESRWLVNKVRTGKKDIGGAVEKCSC